MVDEPTSFSVFPKRKFALKFSLLEQVDKRLELLAAIEKSRYISALGLSYVVPAVVYGLSAAVRVLVSMDCPPDIFVRTFLAFAAEGGVYGLLGGLSFILVWQSTKHLKCIQRSSLSLVGLFLAFLLPGLVQAGKELLLGPPYALPESDMLWYFQYLAQWSGGPGLLGGFVFLVAILSPFQGSRSERFEPVLMAPDQLNSNVIEQRHSDEGERMDLSEQVLIQDD